jgi:hypothetical protein
MSSFLERLHHEKRIDLRDPEVRVAMGGQRVDAESCFLWSWSIVNTAESLVFDRRRNVPSAIM